jgi:hypothetical protein
MEALTNWVTIIYNRHRGNPFSIYGENVFLALQNIIIMTLFIIFGRNVPKGVSIPGRGVGKKYAVFLCSYLLFLFLTKNHEDWPEVLILYSMIVQVFLCN